MFPPGIEPMTSRLWDQRYVISAIEPLLGADFNLPVKCIKYVGKLQNVPFLKIFNNFFGTGALAPVPNFKGVSSILYKNDTGATGDWV